MTASRSPRRWLFVLTILVGSFLLFLVQPMVARMVLPKLGGAPAVWNSAMLVYQALLLGGYAYAHWLGRFTVRRQATIHVALLVAAALWLPIGIHFGWNWMQGSVLGFDVSGIGQAGSIAPPSMRSTATASLAMSRQPNA